MTVRSIYSHTPLELRSISRLQILTTVKFDDQPCSCTIEIRNVITDCFFAFESAPGSLLNNHTIVSVPIGSYSFGVSLQEGYFLYCSLSCSLPPSKIKDFCHLPRQREALVRCEIAHFALHRTVYRSAPLTVRQTGIHRFTIILTSATGFPVPDKK